MAKLTKVYVTEGVYWISAPEAGLHVLCGCPADAVKHLMRRGLILEVEENGVTFENGPNAILLSDIMLQGGAFANLAEFPVLQMLYRQGMVIPNHPRNTGQRPMLLGSKKQVEAQLNYIYRGNYGLISEDEILAAGVAPETAAEMMAVKLSFAFGKIADPAALLETRIVGGEPVEIRGGVMLTRLSINNYEFAFGDEKVSVDLNLKLGQSYLSPYPLGFHRVDREAFAVLHSGEGDGWDINRPTMSSVLLHQGRVFLIDAGPNLLSILNALGIGVNEIEGIFHTHSHDDHFAGLTTLMRTDRRIKYYAAPMVRAAVTKKLTALLGFEEAEFANYFEPHDLVMEDWNDIEGLEVRPIFSPHPVETTVFVFRTLGPDGYKTYGHFADIAAFEVLDRMLGDGDKGISSELIERTKASYLEPLTIKKLDIGGDMIHGLAEDFCDDTSEKIVLAHTARTLTPQEKEIGSGAPFGTVDVLIPGYQNFLLRFVYGFLKSYFPDVPSHGLQALLNNPVADFNPETILIKEGETNSDIYLLLAGNVEMIDSETHATHLLSAGAFIGELSGLHGLPSEETFRAASFVQVLRLPIIQYIEFVKRYDLFGEISRLEENREFLQKAWLFGEAVSYPTQSRIANAMQDQVLSAATKLVELAEESLFIVKSGEIKRISSDGYAQPLAVGEFFGEETALFNMPREFTIEAGDGAQVFRVPGDVLGDIPVVRWKLFETLERRQRNAVSTD